MITKLPDPEPTPEPEAVLDAVALEQGRKLWRKWQGSQIHPGSEHSRWLNERHLWLWFRKYGKQLIDVYDQSG